MNNDYDFFFWLSVIANCCQIESYTLNKIQISNDEIEKHLQNQDNIFNKDISIHLEEIIQQNKEIIELLKNNKV